VVDVSDSHDMLETRCPMLGHLVSFHYCRSMDGLPCRRMMQCWSNRIDVRTYLESRFNDQEIDAILTPPPPKINQLIELIRKARGDAL